MPRLEREIYLLSFVSYLISSAFHSMNNLRDRILLSLLCSLLVLIGTPGYISGVAPLR